MNVYLFDWDDDKNIININKHGVTFKEASTVFKDTNAILLYDYAHSQDEERFVIIGYSTEMRLLYVCHCYRESDAIIRIISARKAGKYETELYEEGGL
jgi:uncharacterized DUF497 family protein